MAAAPPSTASAGDKRKAAAEEKDPDFDLVRDFSDSNQKLIAGGEGPLIFSCRSSRVASCCRKQLKIKPLGAGKEVGRSCILLQYKGKTIMVRVDGLAFMSVFSIAH
jgi:hypothetical protein